MRLLDSFKTCRNDCGAAMSTVMTKVHRTGAGCIMYTTGTQICKVDQKKCKVVTYTRNTDSERYKNLCW